ncbi:hypothetical protein COCON_G00159660 [Conger conger]|uniref:SRR1-like domain-containing protein n=1 Tax=Conger conger TaxID=82655 RepID=A0A9Q1DAP6_CONCO|nr:hypothetical protein COCON_G00159660 [Conger conger]
MLFTFPKQTVLTERSASVATWPTAAVSGRGHVVARGQQGERSSARRMAEILGTQRTSPESRGESQRLWQSYGAKSSGWNGRSCCPVLWPQRLRGPRRIRGPQRIRGRWNDSSLRSCGLDCVCYGLGSFSACVSARYQLAMLILLLDTLRVPPVQCSMFDPVFTPAECEVLQALGFTVLTENEEGKRPVSRPTLFYLIHCGKALYNNLLWRNWSPRALPLLTIVGNSFHSIQERMVRRDLQKNYSFISDVIGACEEMTLPCSPRFLDVFSDTALLRFPPQRLASLPPHTWTQASEPDYQHCEDLEIIQRDQGQPTPTHLDTSL